MSAYLGIDVGTQGTKAGIYAADGTLIAHAYGEHSFTYPGPGWVEMDPWQIEEAVTGAVAVLVIAKHRGNIERLLAGTEHRLGSKKR